MAKNKRINKAQRESQNMQDDLILKLKTILPEAFGEGKVNWERLKQALGERIDLEAEKFTFTWAGKSAAIKNVLVPSKATLRPVKKESVKFDESENLFIEGDNLEVLKLLHKAYFEKVKMIYIDPPYNTGNDFVYRDDFKTPLKNYLEQSGQVDSEGNRLSTNTQASGRYHSDWLTMLYPRIKLAWNLLRHDGVIFISIDDNEIHRLRMLMDEIFGEESFIATLIWKRRASSALADNSVSTDHEYVVCYRKQVFLGFKGREKDYENYKNPDNDPRGEWVLGDLTVGMRASMRPNQAYDLIDPKTKKVYPFNPNRVWAYIPSSMSKLIEENRIYFPKDTSKRPMMKRFKSELKDSHNPFSSLMDNVGMNTEATKLMQDIMEGNVFDYSKPLSLIKSIVTQITNPNTDDIILDFFAGSGTTAQAILENNQVDGGNRKFILVQMPEPTDPKSEAYKAGYKTIADIAKERIRRVIKGYGDDPKPINDGFKVFKLDKSNYADNLFEYDPEKTDDENEKAFKKYLADTDSLFHYDKINELDFVYENIIKEGLDLNAKISELTIGKNKVYKAEDGERKILISLDKKIHKTTVEALKGKEYKEKVFVCFDTALDDSAKANCALNVSLKTI